MPDSSHTDVWQTVDVHPMSPLALMSGARRAPVEPIRRSSFEVVFPSPHSARIIDMLLGALVVGRLSVPGIPSGSFAQLGLAALILISSFRRPTRSVPFWYPVLCAALMVYLVGESLVNHVSPVQRGLNIGLSMVAAAFIASGRIDVASLVKGLGLGLVLNAIAFYARLAPDEYQGRLTGFLLDKNVSGMFYAAVPLLLCAVTPRTWQRLTILAIGGCGVYLTDSRTSMAAYGVALAWMLIAPHLRGYTRIVLLGLLYVGYVWAEDNLSRIGRYALERAGSDALRDRIDAAAAVKVATSPWYGRGLGESTVMIDGAQWFFHNSYTALLVEGGWIMLVGIIGLYVLASFGLFTQVGHSYSRLAVSAAIGALALCATQLGEVFLAQIGFVALGVGLALTFESRPFQGSPWAHSDRITAAVPLSPAAGENNSAQR